MCVCLSRQHYCKFASAAERLQMRQPEVSGKNLLISPSEDITMESIDPIRGILFLISFRGGECSAARKMMHHSDGPTIIINWQIPRGNMNQWSN